MIDHRFPLQVHLASIEGVGNAAFKTALPDGSAAHQIHAARLQEGRQALEIHACCVAHDHACPPEGVPTQWGAVATFLIKPVGCVLQEADSPGGRPTIAGLLFQYCEGAAAPPSPHASTAAAGLAARSLLHVTAPQRQSH